MTLKEKAQIVARVYKNFIEYDKQTGWTRFDDNMYALEWLKDHELHREADSLWEIHTNGNPHCNENHDVDKCFVPVIIEAVFIIMELFKNSNKMTPMMSFVLRVYLTLDAMGKILY